MESVTLAVVLTDKDGVITGLDGATDRFGLGAELVGHPWAHAFLDWQMPAPPFGNPDATPCHVQAIAPTGRVVSMEFFRLSSTGADGPMAAVLRGDEVSTLTERQQQLCGLGEIAANVAHEINNALTLLQGWLDIIASDMNDQDPHRQTIDLLIGEGQRIGRLTSNLLQVARGLGEKRSDLDIGQLVTELVSLVQYEMKHSDIAIESRLSSRLPPVVGNSGRLKQALLNLLINARQAMPSGGKVTITADRDADGHVVICIEDTGCGMSVEVKKHIFSPFYTTKENGTGLGLPVTRKIIEDHGGSVQLESEPDQGARFTLRLPSAVHENE